MKTRHDMGRSLAMAAMAAAFTLAGCGNNNANSSGAESPTTPSSGESAAAATGGTTTTGTGGAATGDVREIEVDSQLADCTGVAPQKCLRIRRTPGGPWELWYSGISGFQHKAGTKYRLRIREEKVANPPADGSSVRWTLVEVLEQSPAKP